MIEVQKHPLDEHVFDDVVEILESCEEPCNQHFDWLKKETEEWAVQRSFFNMLQTSIAVYEGEDKSVHRNALPSLMQEALSVNFNSDFGKSYWENPEDHWENEHSEVSRVPFECDILNKITKGGVPDKKGTLNIFLAPINAGKSTFLIWMAATWARQGKNVIYFSLEMDEDVCKTRLDTTMMDMTFDQVFALNKDEYCNNVRTLQQSILGDIQFKQFVPGTDIGQMRSYLKELERIKSFKPDLIIVDYLGIAGSEKLPPSAKSNSNTYLTSVAEELRGLGTEFKAPIWTAAQFDRTGQASGSVNVTNIASAIGIAATADFMIAGYNSSDLPDNQMIIKQLKSRYNNKNVINKFLIGSDQDKQKYYDLDWSAQRSVMSDDQMEMARDGIMSKNAEANKEKMQALFQAKHDNKQHSNKEKSEKTGSSEWGW